MRVINTILREWAQRVDDGQPNPQNPEHITELVNSLVKYDLPESFIYEFVGNLMEAPKKGDLALDDDEKEQARAANLIPLGNGVWGKEKGKGTHKAENGKLTIMSDDEKKEFEANNNKSSSVDIPTTNVETETETKPNLGPEDFQSDADKDALKKSKKLTQTPTPEKVMMELYGEQGNGPLLQNSKTSDMALKIGYKKNAEHVAPGNAGSNYNENMSNEGALILSKYPDLSETDLIKILFDKTKNTELGKQQKKTSITSGDRQSNKVPKDIPTSQKFTYQNAIISARSARSKYNRINNATTETRKAFGFGKNVEMKSYGGTKHDLENLSNEIQSSNEIYIYDQGSGQTFEIPKETLLEWVSNSGGGENAADTVVVSKDENGKLIFDGWSDKKSLKDIQANSTLNDEYTKGIERIDRLVSSGKLDEETAVNAKEIIKQNQLASNEIESGYENAVFKEGEYFGTLSDEDKQSIYTKLEEQENKYLSDKTNNHVANVRKTMKNPEASYEEILNYLIDSARNKQFKNKSIGKVVNRLATDVRSEYLENDQDIPSMLQTKQIMSDSRDKALDMQRQTINKLNELSGKTTTGKTKPLGDLLGVQDTIDQLHLDKIDEPKNTEDYKQILKRNTHLVMGGIDTPPQNIKGCLGVTDMNDYEDNFEVVTDERTIKDEKFDKYTTGKVIYIYAVNKGGERKFIAEKRYRSKQGDTGKTANTIQWSPDMQACFKSKS
jgi:hypothetical protein